MSNFLKQLFCVHNYVKNPYVFFSLNGHTHDYFECTKCGKHSFIEPWLNYREEEE